MVRESPRPPRPPARERLGGGGALALGWPVTACRGVGVPLAVAVGPQARASRLCLLSEVIGLGWWTLRGRHGHLPSGTEVLGGERQLQPPRTPPHGGATRAGTITGAYVSSGVGAVAVAGSGCGSAS